jgi:tetratricopeptide (TPR) repeat protein
MQEAILSQLPTEVREVLEELARSGVEIRTSEDLQRALENRPDLQEKLEAAWRKMQEAILSQLPAEVREVLEELARSGVEIRTAEDLQRALENRPDLREKLERAAVIGQPSTGGRVAAELRALLEEIVRLRRPSEMPRQVELCERALGMIERENNPVLWAALQGELANALAQNPLGNRAENLEKAIHHFQQALEVYTRQAYPEQWATLQNNLGNAYLERIQGERAENLEQAIFHYQQALEVYTRQAYPEQWAATQNNLGNAYLERIRGERAENLEQAIFHYQQALDVYTRQAYPEQWATTQNNLGNAYLERIRGERAENLEQAIFHYRQALEVRTRQAYPEQWAMTQNNLGNAYLERIRGERAENLEQAIFHFQQALDVYTRQAYPEQWATTQNNLGEAYRNRIRGERAENLEQAIFHYQQALDVYTRQAYPVECRQTARNLGNLAFEQGDWQLACTAYTEAWLAQEILWRSTSLRPNKEIELREMRDIPARLAFAHIRLAQAPQALTTLESGRAQLMREALERSRRDLERLAEIGQQDLLARYRALDERMETLQRLAAAGNRAPDWLKQMEQAQAEWNAVIEEIRRLPGYETFLRSLTAEQIQEQAQDAPLVYLAATPHGGFALLVRDQGEPMVVELPQLTEERLQKQVLGFSAKEYETLQQQAYKENRQPPSPAELLGGYLGAYFRWRESLRPGTPKTEQEAARQAWFEALASTLRWLGEAVMGPVLEALATFLPQGSLVRLVPGGWLSLLPLHAAILTADRGPQTAVALSRPPSAVCRLFTPSTTTPSPTSLPPRRFTTPAPLPVAPPIRSWRWITRMAR